MAKMVFVAVEGCLFSSISNMIDLFGIANRWHARIDPHAGSPPFETTIVTRDGGLVLAHGNIRVLPDGAMTQVEQADVVLIPALAAPGIHEPTSDQKDTLQWLIECHRRGMTLAAMCTGAFLLAETGLLDGRKATTHWQFSRIFKQRHPRVQLQVHRMLTEENGLICTGAATAIFNLGLHLVQRFGSDPLSALCAKSFLIDPQRTSQAPYATFHSPRQHGDRQVLKAQEWMEGHFAEGVAIDAIAAMVGISPRHFKRRFRKATGESPLCYMQNLRIEAAKTRLATTRSNVDEITYAIGYEDSSTFRRLFKKQVGLSPREYRDKFFTGRKAA